MEHPMHRSEQTTGVSRYIYRVDKSILKMMQISSGKITTFNLSNGILSPDNVWVTLPGERLYSLGLTALCLQTTKDFAVTFELPMLLPRICLGVVYHQNSLYAIGGWRSRMCEKACERLLWKENSWEELPSLPIAAKNLSLIVLEETRCLYATGECRPEIDSMQALNLDTLEWVVMGLKLPFDGRYVVSFKLDESQAYFLCNKCLYVFCPKTDSLQHLGIDCNVVLKGLGTGIFHSGALYCSKFFGATMKWKIEGLLNCS